MISVNQIANRLVEATGAATAYFHRLLNEIINILNGQVGRSGLETLTPDGSGLATITHGYQVTGQPVAIGQCSVVATGSTAFHVQIVDVTATELQLKLFDMAGAALTTGSWPVAWKVAG